SFTPFTESERVVTRLDHWQRESMASLSERVHKKSGICFILQGPVTGYDCVSWNWQEVDERHNAPREVRRRAHKFMTRGLRCYPPPPFRRHREEADGTASAVGGGSSRACKCRWAPYVRGHDPRQGQLPVSTIKAPGHRIPDARSSTRPSI